MEIGGAALTVTKVERVSSSGPLLKAKADEDILIAEVLVENVSRDKVSPNPLFFKVKDADGFEYTPALGVEQQIGSDDLPRGDKSRGNVAFVVKKGVKGLVLFWQSVPFDSSSIVRVAIPDA